MERRRGRKRTECFLSERWRGLEGGGKGGTGRTQRGKAGTMSEPHESALLPFYRVHSGST